MRALEVYAGPRARAHLLERGLQPNDVHVVPGAAGGPKGLVLNAIDQLLLTQWLPKATHPVHLMGASIGAWRMAIACLPNAPAMFEQWAHDYIHQSFPSAPGRAPTAVTVSNVFSQKLDEHIANAEAKILAHPTYRMHVFTSRGRGLLSREGRALSKVTTPLAYAGAFVSNVAHRRAMGGWLERVVFSDPRNTLPVPLNDYRTQSVALNVNNLKPSILASCSIPFVLQAVHNIPGAPPGAYWDGGVTDYHLHLNYAAMKEGLVLYPHFQASVVPGWLDKSMKWRHKATPWLDNVIVLAPAREWIAGLPRGKLPDRQDFKHYANDYRGRVGAWTTGWRECQRLADELEHLLRQPSIDAKLLT